MTATASSAPIGRRTASETVSTISSSKARGLVPEVVRQELAEGLAVRLGRQLAQSGHGGVESGSGRLKHQLERDLNRPTRIGLAALIVEDRLVPAGAAQAQDARELGRRQVATEAPQLAQLGPGSSHILRLHARLPAALSAQTTGSAQLRPHARRGSS